MALPALWLGLLYDEQSLDFIDARLVTLGHDAWAAARAKVSAEGLRATIAETTVGALANELLAVADAALARRARLDAQGRDERMYLAPLIEAAARGQSIGDVVLGDWSAERPDALASLLARAAY
jgi:glutamate--cysteine ligase